MTNRKICQRVLESVFKVPLKKTTINGHTLDFYNKDLKIGLAYNSIHRYKFSSKFHKTWRHFLFYKNEPELRTEACREAGIKLIVIPFNTGCILRVVSRVLEIPNTCKCERCSPFVKYKKYK